MDNQKTPKNVFFTFQ